jgi:hypothetical protein
VRPSILVALVAGIVLAGCFREEPSANADEVSRCVAGMKRALRTSTRGDALQTYQRACSGLYDNAECRTTLERAEGSVSGDWLTASLSVCAKEYCPVISSDIKACKAGAVEGPEAIDQAWVELSYAILRRSDERRAGGTVFAFARFFADLNAHMPPRRGTHAVSAVAVERCERGIEHAATLPSPRGRRSAYYKECASVYEQECFTAFTSASKAEPEQQESIVLVGCRKTYCPWFSVGAVEACDGEFVPTREAVARAWPALNRAILDLDAKPYAERLLRTLSSLDDVTARDAGRGPVE